LVKTTPALAGAFRINRCLPLVRVGGFRGATYGSSTWRGTQSIRLNGLCRGFVLRVCTYGKTNKLTKCPPSGRSCESCNSTRFGARAPLPQGRAGDGVAGRGGAVSRTSPRLRGLLPRGEAVGVRWREILGGMPTRLENATRAAVTICHRSTSIPCQAPKCIE
jgi:hypothetical protein